MGYFLENIYDHVAKLAFVVIGPFLLQILLKKDVKLANRVFNAVFKEKVFFRR